MYIERFRHTYKHNDINNSKSRYEAHRELLVRQLYERSVIIARQHLSRVHSTRDIASDNDCWNRAYRYRISHRELESTFAPFLNLTFTRDNLNRYASSGRVVSLSNLRSLIYLSVIM